MPELLIRVIPLNVASIISPVMLALSIILMSSKFHPLKKTLIYILGTILVGIFAIFFGFSVAKVTSKAEPTLASSLVDLILGLFLTYYALKTLFKKNKEKKEHIESQNIHFFKLLTLGVAVNLSNLDGLTLSFLAAREVSEALIGQLAEITLLFINLFFLILPALLPVILYLYFPKKAEVVLSGINSLLVKYGSYIVGLVFLFFGAYLFSQAWNFFFVK